MGLWSMRTTVRRREQQLLLTCCSILILPSFYPVSVFQWCAAELLLEIFTEEQCVGEAQRIGNLINGQIRVGKIITDILHNIFRYPLQGRFAADFLADGGEVLRFDTDIKSSVAG